MAKAPKVRITYYDEYSREMDYTIGKNRYRAHGIEKLFYNDIINLIDRKKYGDAIKLLRKIKQYQKLPEGKMDNPVDRAVECAMNQFGANPLNQSEFNNKIERVQVHLDKGKSLLRSGQAHLAEEEAYQGLGLLEGVEAEAASIMGTSGEKRRIVHELRASLNKLIGHSDERQGRAPNPLTQNEYDSLLDMIIHTVDLAEKEYKWGNIADAVERINYADGLMGAAYGAILKPGVKTKEKFRGVNNRLRALQKTLRVKYLPKKKNPDDWQHPSLGSSDIAPGYFINVHGAPGLMVGYEFEGYDRPRWEEKPSHPHPHYKLIVLHGKKKQTFNYWGSRHDYDIGKKTLSEIELVEAFTMLLEDIRASKLTLKDFALEFGYVTQAAATATWKACKTIHEKWKKLNYRRGLSNTINDIRDHYDL